MKSSISLLIACLFVASSSADQGSMFMIIVIFFVLFVGRNWVQAIV